MWLEHPDAILADEVTARKREVEWKRGQGDEDMDVLDDTDDESGEEDTDKDDVEDEDDEEDDSDEGPATASTNPFALLANQSR